VCIRAIQPDDKRLLAAGFGNLSKHSIYRRFFYSKRELSEKDLVSLTEVDSIHRAALVGTITEHGDSRIVGVGRYTTMENDPSHAEVAFIVADDFQGNGLCTTLLEHLVTIALGNGISTFEADVLGENRHMLGVFRRCGFPLAIEIESDVTHVSFSISGIR
jgi:RimJ/RimL family protein N-acetyltransferase